jgi:hypothetical protein
MPWYISRNSTPEEIKEYQDEFYEWLEDSAISQEEYQQLDEILKHSLRIAFEDFPRNVFNRRSLYKLPPLNQQKATEYKHRMILKRFNSEE